MGRECFFTGKRTQFGMKKTTRGKAKYLGGVGTKITGLTRRKVKPNLQCVRAMVDGRIVRVMASVSAIRSGLVVKPVVHQPFTLDRDKSAKNPKAAEKGKNGKAPAKAKAADTAKPAEKPQTATAPKAAAEKPKTPTKKATGPKS